MKKQLSLFLLLLLSLSLCSCDKSAGSFSHLEEDYTINLPIYTLSSYESSLGSSTYTYSNVVHDEQGHIISWDKQEGSRSAKNYTATYNDNGQLASVTYHDSLYGYTEVYLYNEQGLLIEKTKTEPDDANYYETTTYTYNENGILTESETNSSSGAYDGDIDEYTFTYNDRGWITEDTQYAVNIDLLYENQFEYNEAGQIVKDYQSTTYEGFLERIYKTTYRYDMYGFPVYALVDNYYDYEGDTAIWETLSTYAVTGTVPASSTDDDMLNPVSTWVAYPENNVLPTADSVLSGLTAESGEKGEYRYAIPADDSVIPEFKMYGIMQGLNYYSIIDLHAYSAQDAANQVLWRYQAVLEQVLGLQTTQQADTLIINDGESPIGSMTIQFSHGVYYLVVKLG